MSTDNVKSTSATLQVNDLTIENITDNVKLINNQTRKKRH